MTPVTPVVPGFDLPVTVFAKDQPEYIPLPSFKCEDEYGTVVTRWRLDWKERLLIAFGGDLWLSMLTFNRPLQPVKLQASCPIMGHAMGDPEI